MGRLTNGIAAGTAGTTFLNVATYLDMAVRGRPASSVPETAVDRLAGMAGAAQDWVSDIVPHLAYGAATVGALDAMS